MRSCWVVMVLVVASCSSKHEASPPPPPARTHFVETPPAVDGALIDADAHHLLTAAEGTILIAPLLGARDQALVGAITVSPGDGYRVNTDLQPRLDLAPPTAVVITPPRLARWDRGRLDIAFSVTAHEAGAYELHGSLHFAVCKLEACFPKDEPLSIAIEIR